MAKVTKAPPTKVAGPTKAKSAAAASAKAPAKATAPKVTMVQNDTSGRYLVVTGSDGTTLRLRRDWETKDVTAAAVIGQPMAPLPALFAFAEAAGKKNNPGKLANGVNAHNAPQSAAAAADNRKAPAKAKAEKPAPKAKPEPKAPAKAPKADGKNADRKITVLCKDAATTAINPTSDRYAKLAFVIKTKPTTLGAVLGKPYNGNGKKLLMGCIHGMIKRGHVKLD